MDRRRGVARVQAPTAPAWVDLLVEDAAPRLGLTKGALWARLRRGTPDEAGFVQLGGGVVAYRMGAKSWRVRFPAEPVSTTT